MTVLDVAALLWLIPAVVGMTLAVSFAGLPLLGAGAFLAIGGYGTALLGPGGLGLPLLLALLASVALAAVAGYLLAAGAARLEGAPLALATWGLAWLVHRGLFAYPDLTGGVDGLTRTAPAHLVSPVLGLDLALTPWAHVVLAGIVGLLLLAALARLQRGPAGLDLAALREGPELALSLGVDVAGRRRAVLATTAALCALSGAGSGVLLGLVSPGDVSPVVSLQLLVAVLLVGARWWGVLVALAVLNVLPGLADAVAIAAGWDAERSRGVLTAALLLAVVLVRRALTGRGQRAAGPQRAEVLPPHPVTASPSEVVHPVLLQALGVTHRYRGVLALDQVDLELRGGEVHALVGPNGSGKSTLLKVLAGDLPGQGIEIAGTDRLRSGVRARVQAGVVRTPQQTSVMPHLTADRQVAVGARGACRVRFAVLRHLLVTPSSRIDTQSPTVLRAMALCDVRHLVGASPRTLKVGDQRLLQIARAIATGARILLLDEPAAGMTSDERARLRTVLVALAGNGFAVLLVEHDMRLVGEVADRVTVLDAGRVIASGSPDVIRRDPIVQRAYLGTPIEELTS